MSWFGKLGGAGLGWLLGGPIGGLIGAALGHIVDEAVEEENRKRDINSENYQLSDEDIQLIYITSIIAMMAKIAKADGIVSREEADFVKAFMINDMELTGELYEYAKNVFNSAKNDNYSIEEYAHQFKKLTDFDPQMRYSMLNLLFNVAAVDGILDPGEEVQLKKVADVFGIKQNEFEELKKIYCNIEDLTRYYNLLGCRDTNVSLEEVKKCYLEKVKKYHPDTLAGKDLPEEIIKLAEEKFKEIQEAYDKILGRR